jgi:hypothetical protein
MKTNKDFRKFGDDGRRGESVKGKVPLKKKKSKRSIYDEIDEDEDTGYSSFRKKESVEDYLDDFEDFVGGEFGKEFDFFSKEYGEKYDEDAY